ncbi:MAG: hypothetical protein V3S51_00405 [Dehalococcoidia bacterium]
MNRRLLLLPVLVLGFYLASLPHAGYLYPVRLDEWLHMAFSQEVVEEASALNLTDPFSGYGTHDSQAFEVSFHVPLATFQEIRTIKPLPGSERT